MEQRQGTHSQGLGSRQPRSLLCRGLSVCLAHVSARGAVEPIRLGVTLADLPILSLWVCFPLCALCGVALGKIPFRLHLLPAPLASWQGLHFLRRFS